LRVLPTLPAFRTIPFHQQPNWDGLSLASPFFGIYATTEWASRLWFDPSSYSMWGSGPPLAHDDPSWPLIWIGVHSAIALILAFATVRTFDRCLGRVPESPRV